MNKILIKIGILMTLFTVLSNNYSYADDFFSWEQWSSDLLSPWTTSARYSLISGAGLTTSVLIFEDHISDPLQKDTNEDRPLGKYSTFGDLAGQCYPNIAYVLVTGVSQGFLKNTNGYRKAGVMFRATSLAILATTLMKYTVREPRPNNGDDRRSFPSGHTATAFAFAGTIGVLEGWQWGIPAYALASLVGYSRMNDNKHWLHDVAAGATIGMSYGIGVALNSTQKQQAKWTIGPLFLGISNSMGIKICLNIN